MPDPVPGPGEVRLRIAVSGVNPGDVKKRQNAFGYGMPYPRVIPHSDGAGIVERVGEGVPSEWVAGRAGANEVVVAGPDLIERVQALAPHGVDHIVEVALGANVGIDLEVLALGGSIVTYATDAAAPVIPYGPLVFKNVRLFFLGSDDFPPEARISAVRDLNAALQAGWSGAEIAERVPLADIARANELVEQPGRGGRVVVML